MEVWRHISSGRLSELFGSSTLSEDRFIRTLGWRQAAERDLAALSPDARAALDAYAVGVNDWIADHHGSLSLPFVVDRAKAGLGGLGGYHARAVDGGRHPRLAEGPGVAARRQLRQRDLPDARRRDARRPRPDRRALPAVRPVDAGDHPERAEGLRRGGRDRRRRRRRGSSAARRRAGGPTAGARRPGEAAAWRDLVPRPATGSSRSPASTPPTASPATTRSARTTSSSARRRPRRRRALLANDPHLGIGMPSVWYMNGLRCRVDQHGLPVRRRRRDLPGRSRASSSATTRRSRGARRTSTRTSQDLFAIEPSTRRTRPPTSSRASRSRTRSATRRSRSRAAPTSSSTSGPPATARSSTTSTAASQDAPLAGPALDGDRRRRRHVRRDLPPDTATTFEEFHAAFETYGAPSQNFVYADTDGHIGYVLPGRIPIRADANDRGDRIRSGSDGKHDWTGTIPFEDLPWQLDPPSGMIVTANNAAVDDSYPYFIAQEWDPGYRAKRITDLLGAAAASGGVSTGDAPRHPDGPDRDTRGAGDPAPHRRPAELTRRRWRARRGSDPELADARLHRRTRSAARPTRPSSTASSATSFDDELGAARPRVRREQRLVAGDDRPPRPAGLAVVGRRPTTDRPETRDDILGRALDEAGRRAAGRLRRPGELDLGPRSTRPRFEEATLGSSGIGPLEWYFDKGPFPAPGAAGRGEQHLLPAVAGLSRIRTTRPTCRSASTASSRHEPAVVPADDRHGRPRRRADHPDDRPERQPVRPPLRRPDRRAGWPARRSRCRSRRRPSTRRRQCSRLVPRPVPS